MLSKFQADELRVLAHAVCKARADHAKAPRRGQPAFTNLTYHHTRERLKAALKAFESYLTFLTQQDAPNGTDPR